jgi:hypothetical protein
MSNRRLLAVLIVTIFIGSLTSPIVSTVLGGEDDFLEEFDDSTYKAASTTVAGWNEGEVSLSRVDPTNYSVYDTTGWGYDMDVEGNFAYIADGSPGLVIINVTDITNPTPAGIYSSGMFMYSVDADANVAYVGESSRIRSVNIVDPDAPFLLNTRNIGGTFYDVDVVGDWLFAAGSWSGLTAVNISNPLVLGPHYTYNTPMSAYNVEVSGDFAYVADYYTIEVLNVSDPTSMTLVTSFDTGANNREWALFVEGDFLYITTYDFTTSPYTHKVICYDISDPSAPTYVDEVMYQTSNWYTRDLVVDGNYLYVAGYSDGVLIVDVSDPYNMKLLDSQYNNDGYSYRVRKVGSELYVADGTVGMTILNVSSLTTPTSASTYDSPGSARSVRIQGNFAYVADDTSGLRIVNISDPDNIASEGSYSTGTSNTYGAWVSGDYAYMADDTNGLHIINVTDPSSPSLMGTFDTGGNAYDVQVLHKTAYVADQSQGLRIIDVTDPADTDELGFYDTGSNAFAVWTSGNVAYIADDANGIVAVNVLDPTSPALLDTYDTGGRAVDVEVDGDIAYVADRAGGLVILDVSDPSNMELAATFDTDGEARGVYVAGNHVFVADDSEGLQIINVSDPWNPVLADNITTLNNAWAVAVAGNYSFVANRNPGLTAVHVYDNVADLYESVGFAESTVVDTTTDRIVAANLTVNETKPAGTNIFYNISNDGGSTWTPTTPGTLTRFPTYLSSLMWKANLTTIDNTVSPSIQNVSVRYYYDDLQPESNATDGAPEYDNEGTIPVQWVATDPFPDTGVAITYLYFRYDSNYDGDFTDLGDIGWSWSGLLGQSGESGTFYFNPEDNNGMYEFYTRAIDNASHFEDAPASADDSTMFDNVIPSSDCYDGSPTYANSGTITVWYNSSDPSPGSGIQEVSLFYRLDTNNDGDFTDVGDTEWADSGLTPQTSESGSFNFNPQGKDGRYEFFTLAEDNATNMERYPPVRDSFTIFDSHAPTSSHYIGGALTSSGWYVGSVYVFLSAEDSISGVNVTKFRVDEGEWKVYNTPFIIAQDGAHKVEYYSQDMAKNDEDVIEFTVNIDNSAPETSYQLSGTLGNNGWYTSAVDVTLTSVDDHSTVNKTRYRINGANWQTYSTPFTISDDGEYDVEFYAFDNAGNDEERGDFFVKIDKTAPTVSHTLIGNPSDDGVYPTEVTVMVAATDGMSDISTVEYKLAGLDWAPYSAPFILSADGNHTFQYKATDLAGNVANSAYVTVEIDTTPPEVDLTLTGEKKGTWYTSAVDVMVTAEDETSDIAEVLISIDRGPWETYTGIVKVSEPGTHTVDAKALDTVGQESKMASVGFKIDNKAPITVEHHAGAVGNGGWMITDVQVTLTSTDDGSGVENITYRVDGGNWAIYSGGITLSDDGVHTIEYQATDVAGNTEPVKSATISIDKTPPDIVFTSHTDGQVVAAAAQTLIGSTGSDATMTLNGEAVTVGGNGAFTKALTLTEGENVIKAKAVDVAGHMAEAEIVIILDTTPPTINVYSPYEGMKTTEKTVTVQGSTEPGSSVTVDGEAVSVDEYGAFTATVELEIGDADIVVKATDPQGNVGEMTKHVTREKVEKVSDERTAKEAMPAFILALLLVAVIVGLLAYMMGRKMGGSGQDVDEDIDATTPRHKRVRRERRVAREHEPRSERGSDLSSMESEGEFGPSDSEWK